MNTPVRRPSSPPRPVVRTRVERLTPVPLLARLRPVPLTLGCMVLVALLALLYLSQVGAVASANQQMQALQATQATLQQQDELAHARLGAAQNPAYIRQRAAALGLVPAPPSSIIVITVPGLGTSDTQSGAGGQP